MYDANTAPIRANIEHVPVMEALWEVGNISEENIQLMAKAADTPNFPSVASTRTAAGCSRGGDDTRTKLNTHHVLKW